MDNIFTDLNTETSLDNIKTFGAKTVYESGIHSVSGAEVFLYESEYNGTTYTNAEIVLTTPEGAVLVEELRVTPKSNQDKSTTDFLNYMTNIALVTGKLDALEQLKTQFAALPSVKYTNKYKKEVTAKSVKLFANSPFKIMTFSEISGGADGIYTSQRLNLVQVFRASDNASLAEIKDKKDEVGGSYEYFTENPETMAAKAQLRWVKPDSRSDLDTEVLTEVLDYIKDGGKLSKDQREAIQEHWSVENAKAVLSGKVSEPKPVVDDTEDDYDEDESPFG